ncbi:DUF3352 domain-containing protein [Limnofasciculus baicalensis]|uniref:DUF3352 domain-containing protein n=1 Tax=Limnofasciculus baicalensis BBK-W-15 TaxID=2699891 RepID=A0AAE3KMZ6_9CYAN|nr:DUF3352 domain-containing protein [Limnofasciculus baicalensis]MCP2730005.1 DUF3352 domain-containing protein [Limnofasciculus baicalensis BBK-W-15]
MFETKSKSNFIVPAIAGITLVTVSGVAAYFYFTHPSGETLSSIGAAKVIPDEAVLVSYISTDPKSWANLHSRIQCVGQRNTGK